MISKEIVHALILVFAIVLTFIFPKTNLANYDLQITAILFIVLYSIKRFVVTKDVYSRLIESVVFTLIIMGVVNSTGGLTSPFFFIFNPWTDYFHYHNSNFNYFFPFESTSQSRF